jgi:hypothetical protein
MTCRTCLADSSPMSLCEGNRPTCFRNPSPSPGDFLSFFCFPFLMGIALSAQSDLIPGESVDGQHQGPPGTRFHIRNRCRAQLVCRVVAQAASMRRRRGGLRQAGRSCLGCFCSWFRISSGIPMHALSLQERQLQELLKGACHELLKGACHELHCAGQLGWG